MSASRNSSTSNPASRCEDPNSGDGWSAGPGGVPVWGKYGAAGLFLVAEDDDCKVLMQHRAPWTNFGDTWGIPGGAKDLDESVEDAALRECVEECGIDPALVEVVETLVTAGPYEAAGDLRGGWTYSTVIARTTTGQPLDTIANNESLELRWVPLADLRELALLEPFEKSLEAIIAKLR